MNIEDLNKTRDLLLKINTLLIEESKCSEASLDSYKTLTSIVKEIQALEIPNNDKIIDYACNFIVDEAGIEQFQLTSKSIIEQCEFFFEKYNSSKLSEKYSFKNLEDILQNLYYKPHFRKEGIEKEKWGRIYNDLKNNPNAVQEDILDVLQNLQVANTNLDSKMSEALLIYNQHICSIISDPYKKVARLIRPLYTRLKKKDTEVEPKKINQQNLPEKKKRGRPKSIYAATLKESFVKKEEYHFIISHCNSFFLRVKARPKDINNLYSHLADNKMLTDKCKNQKWFCTLILKDSTCTFYSKSSNSLSNNNAGTHRFNDELEEWIRQLQQSNTKK